MDVVILCGGRGTRLWPETEFRPKPLLPVGGRPILDCILGHFLRYGFRRFVLCLGYHSAAIRKHFLTRASGGEIVGSDDAVSVDLQADGGRYTAVLVDTGLDTATGGRVKRAEAHLRGERFVLAYGDVLSDIDLARLCAFHRQRGRLATVTAVRPVSPFGHLVLDDRHLVVSFREKPVLNDWINIGFVILERTVLQRLTVDSPQLELGLFPEIAAEGQMSAYRHLGCFEPMDTYADYVRLNEMDGAGELDWTNRVSS
jgi:glucose-1-phosphate cytidylyltransferase